MLRMDFWAQAFGVSCGEAVCGILVGYNRCFAVTGD